MSLYCVGCGGGDLLRQRPLDREEVHLKHGFELGLSGGREKSLGKQGVLKKQSKEDHPGNQACGPTGHQSANGEFTPKETEITRRSEEDFKISMFNTRHNKKTIKLKGPPSIKDI